MNFLTRCVPINAWRVDWTASCAQSTYHALIRFSLVLANFPSKSGHIWIKLLLNTSGAMSIRILMLDIDDYWRYWRLSSTFCDEIRQAEHRGVIPCQINKFLGNWSGSRLRFASNSHIMCLNMSPAQIRNFSLLSQTVSEIWPPERIRVVSNFETTQENSQLWKAVKSLFEKIW